MFPHPHPKEAHHVATSLLTLCSLLLLAQAALAQDAATENKLKDAPKFEADKAQPLFNGKDFTGWRVPKEPGPKIEDVWSVKEDGVLHCKGKPDGLHPHREGLHELQAEARMALPRASRATAASCSALQPPDKVWPKSIEAQLQSKNAGDIWNIDEFQMKTAADRTKGRHTKKMHETNEKPLGEWNTYEITLDGTDLELKVNGLVQNVATDCEVIPGKIALQSEGAEIEFRNIVLTPLAGRRRPRHRRRASRTQDARRVSKAGTSPATATGRSRTASSKASRPETEKSYTHVVSDKSYKDFKASLKFKAVKGNSGFYFRVKPDERGPDASASRPRSTRRATPAACTRATAATGCRSPKTKSSTTYFKPQEWNEMTVEGHGPHVVVHVNGTKAAEINDTAIAHGRPVRPADPRRAGRARDVQGHQDRGAVELTRSHADRHRSLDEAAATSCVAHVSLSLACRAARAAAPTRSLRCKRRRRLFASLTPEQRKQATLPYDTPERNAEVYTGGKRAGVQIKDLDAEAAASWRCRCSRRFTSDYGDEEVRSRSPTSRPTPTTRRPASTATTSASSASPGKGKTYAWRIAEHHLTLVHVEVEKGEPEAFGPILLGANPPTLWDAEEDEHDRPLRRA